MHRLVLCAVAGLLGFAGAFQPVSAQQVSNVRIDLVLTAASDTPGSKGFLPTGQAEAEIALKHAELAVSQSANLDWIKQQIRHVLNAIDPKIEPNGPGLGYGVRKSTEGIAENMYIGPNVAWEDVSENVKLHAVEVSTSIENVLLWLEEIAVLSQEVSTASTASEAEDPAGKILALIRKIVHGFDTDGDGETSWERGEGGFAQAAQRLRIMAEGEGLN